MPIEPQTESSDLEPYNAEQAFEEAWRDVVFGNTYPVATLWDDLDDKPLPPTQD